MSAYSYDTSRPQDASITFSFQIYDRPGVLAEGATAVVDYKGSLTPEPATGMLMLAALLPLLVHGFVREDKSAIPSV